MNKNKMAYQLAEQAVQRFPQAPDRTLARYLIANNPDYYDGDAENARSAIRYYRGHCGAEKRAAAKLAGSLCKKVECPPTLRLQRNPHRLSSGKWLVLGDVHIPFHEPKAVEATMNFAHKSGCNKVMFAGDIQDCKAISFWPKTQRLDFVDEVERVIDFLDYIKNAKFKETVWLRGNHDNLIERFYHRYAPQLALLPTSNMETILSLKNRKIKLLDPFQRVVVGKHLTMFHGHEMPYSYISVNPARWLFLKAKACAVCFHFHRTSSHNETTVLRELISTWSAGCLCDLHPDYSSEANNWNWGFMILSTDGDTWEIENKRVLQSGKVI